MRTAIGGVTVAVIRMRRRGSEGARSFAHDYRNGRVVRTAKVIQTALRQTVRFFAETGTYDDEKGGIYPFREKKLANPFVSRV